MQDDRQKLIVEARTWLGTPHGKRGLVKGSRCDCYTFVVLCLQAIGLAAGADFPVHGDDWWTNCTDQEYYRRLMKFTRDKARGRGLWGTMSLSPGDIVLVRCRELSEIFNHGGIVTDWPRLIHCADEVREVSAWQDPMWRGHEILALDPFTVAGPDA